jgi:hypothetical protein
MNYPYRIKSVWRRVMRWVNFGRRFTARNPKTGLEVTVKPKTLPFFKVGKELKERIMEGCGGL